MMSTGEQPQAAQATAEAQVQEISLDDIISATKQTERPRAQELLGTLVDQALAGVVKYDKNVTKTINAAIAALDQKLSTQLAAIMHHPDFQKLEGSWRGLNYLVMNSETSAQLKIKVFNVPKRELFKDVDKAVEFDQSQIFKKLYENEYGMAGASRTVQLIGDYEFTNHPRISTSWPRCQRGRGRVRPVHLGRRPLALRPTTGKLLRRPGRFHGDRYTSGGRIATAELRFATLVMPRVWPACPMAPRPSRSKSSATRKSTRASRSRTTISPG
jgi:hypothetical protein